MPIRFVEALITDLSLRAREDITLLPFMAQLVKAGRKGFDDQPARERTRLPAPADGHLETALANLDAPAEMVEGIRVANEEGAWGPVLGDHPDLPDDLTAGLNALHVLGSNGLLGCEGYKAGLFLMTPNIHYPPHTHTPVELYYCVSGSVTIRHGIDGEDRVLTAGNYSITPRERLHSLTTGDDPALIIYGWIGDFDTPMYLWEQDEEEGWRRSAYTRHPDATWHRGPLEPVTEDLLDSQRINRETGS